MMPTNMSKAYVRTEIAKIPQPIFIDSAIFIYLFEDHPKYASLLEPLFNNEAVKKISSVIMIAEVLTKPFERKNSELINHYQEIFNHLPNLSIVSLDRESAILGSQIKAQYGFHLIDSFQLALAEKNNCVSFLTNDKQLEKYKNLSVVCLEKYFQ